MGVALANIDEMIALIKAAKTPAEAKAGILAKGWALGQVKELLEQAGVEDTKPEDLEDEYGWHEGGYHLSPVTSSSHFRSTFASFKRV